MRIDDERPWEFKSKAPAPNCDSSGEADTQKAIDEMFDKAQPITPEMLDVIGKATRKILDKIAAEADSTSETPRNTIDNRKQDQ